MSHQERVFLIAIVIICIIALTLLAVVGSVMLWFMFTQPAKWKMWSDKTDSFLVAKKLCPESVMQTLQRLSKPAAEKLLVGIGLISSIVVLYILIHGVWRLHR